MWDKKYKIYGYHIRDIGKPIEVSKEFDPKRRCVEVRTVIPLRGGKLLASIAIVRDPRDPNTFLRAVARVHEKDLGLGSKARGREIAVGRMKLALEHRDLSKVDVLSFDELTPVEQRLIPMGE